jgi:hypothetical protein
MLPPCKDHHNQNPLIKTDGSLLFMSVITLKDGFSISLLKLKKNMPIEI